MLAILISRIIKEWIFGILHLFVEKWTCYWCGITFPTFLHATCFYPIIIWKCSIWICPITSWFHHCLLAFLECINWHFSCDHEVVNIPFPFSILLKEIFTHKCLNEFIYINGLIIILVSQFENSVNYFLRRVVQPQTHEFLEIFCMDVFIVDITHEMVEHVTSSSPALLLITLESGEVNEIFDF